MKLKNEFIMSSGNDSHCRWDSAGYKWSNWLGVGSQQGYCMATGMHSQWHRKQR